MIKLFEDGSIVKTVDAPGRHLAGGRQFGTMQKHYLLTKKHKRLIRSSAIRQALTKKNNLLFCTLTFPRDIDQGDANKCFSNYVDNLKTNYKLNSYVAVKENTKRGRPHFHCVFDIPFTDFKKLNSAWNSSIRNYMPGSNNSFTTGRRPIVSNVFDVSRYITKYITKTEVSQYDVKPTTRQYFISENVLSQPGSIDYNTLLYLLTKSKYSIYIGDFFTVYKLHDFATLPEKWQKQRRPPPKVPPNNKQKFNRDLPELSPNFGFSYQVINRH